MPFETRGVLAGAYTARNPRSLLTHAVELDTSGSEIAVLCTRVNLDSIVDRYGMTETQAAAPPSCPVCAKRLAKRIAGRAATPKS